METNQDDNVIDVEQINNILCVKSITKREYFAACALQGYDMYKYITITQKKTIARQCVSMADALIEELNN